MLGATDRSVALLRNLEMVLRSGRLGGNGYQSILPVDEGIEHSAAASLAANPAYLDPNNIWQLATEAGCNAVATTFGALALVADGTATDQKTDPLVYSQLAPDPTEWLHWQLVGSKPTASSAGRC